jgi:hypothetical protein
MFTVIQVRDFSGKPLDEQLLRTVYAVDRATNSFLVKSCLMSEFIWIPIDACIPIHG